MLQSRGNVLGVIMFVIGGVIAGIGGLVFKLGDAPIMIMVGVALFLMDMVIRLRVRTQPGWLMSKQMGGYFFFIPVWLLGLFVIAINIINGLGLLS
ncbi:MAG TPA: hypothetical protein DCY14_14985 [Anaerolineae bacterium]|nr:hypothetical protein [Anaerolineae bacterium]HRJ55994.1 hypothetical protein [Anaerolineales bacterium]